MLTVTASLSHSHVVCIVLYTLGAIEVLMRPIENSFFLIIDKERYEDTGTISTKLQLVLVIFMV